MTETNRTKIEIISEQVFLKAEKVSLNDGLRLASLIRMVRERKEKEI